MRLALALFKGTGTSTDPYTPDCAPVGRWGCYDLRVDDTKPGVGLVLGVDDAGPIAGALVDLGDPVDPSELSPAIRAAIALQAGRGGTQRDRRMAVRELMSDVRARHDGVRHGVIANVELWRD